MFCPTLSVGLMIFEVKDWNANNYRKEGRKYFVTDNRGEWPIQSPVNQVERYRNNLLNFYLPQIGEAIDENPKNLSAIKVGLYFHNMDTLRARELVQDSYCAVFGRDYLQERFLGEIVPDNARSASRSMKKE